LREYYRYAKSEYAKSEYAKSEVLFASLADINIQRERSLSIITRTTNRLAIENPLCEESDENMALTRRIQMALLLAANTVVVAATKQCVQLELPIPVVVTNERYDIRRVDNTIDAVQWALDFSVWNQPSDRTIEPLTIAKNYSISAELCVPTKKTDKSDILQIAVHGNAWDKRCVAPSIESCHGRTALFQVHTDMGGEPEPGMCRLGRSNSHM
jgi:hypothetical protein